jgi:hypothetical protein
MTEPVPVLLEVDHPEIRRVDPAIFTLSFAADCMTHDCRCRDEGDRRLADACCQHGADLDLVEREAILRRSAEVASVLRPEFRPTARWFDDSDPEVDEHNPSGRWIRTGLVDPRDEASGCVFLQHGGRGCALHRAAVHHGFDPNEIKPMVCRLYPLSWGDRAPILSDDFDRYSCAHVASGPSIYRVSRPSLVAIFGIDVVAKLDRLERSVGPRRLPLVASL